MATAMAEGFLRDSVTGALELIDVGAAVAPVAVQAGFLRDANLFLVTTTVAPGTALDGMPRGAAVNGLIGPLVIVEYASLVAPAAILDGFLRDANRSIVVVSAALASGAQAYTRGFLRDANYALVHV